MMINCRIRISQLLFLLLAILVFISTSGWETRYPLLGALFFLIGCSLVGIACLGRLWCSLYIAGYKTEKLITDGPYSMSRNPLYFSSFLGAIGVGFAAQSLIIPFVVLVAFALIYLPVIKNEEKLLKETHGKYFDIYRSKVPCFFPNLFSLSEPQEYIVKPMIFRRNIVSTFWFVCLIGVLKLIEELHALEIIPVLFTIY
jgi:protein-S-isoprenylcysteine O-methyltransferase Ste14